jgi:monoterpene epsilon-lactone hydrolase
MARYDRSMSSPPTPPPPAFARALIAAVAMRRRQRGPLRAGWSLETETLSRVLHHYTKRSTVLPLAWQRRALGILGPPPEDRRATFERVDADGVPGAWIRPIGADPSRVVYYLHGGGYSVGSIESHRHFVAHLAAKADAHAFLIDYRLAPEHCFPAQLDDARTAWRWLLARGVDPRRAVIAGESAGGGLTMSTLVSLRDAREPLPVAAMVISPWVDLTLSGRAIDDNARFDYLSRRVLRTYVERVAGDTDPAHPLLSPAFADLRALPPLFVQVGAAEGLLDDARMLVRRAKEHGTPVELREHDDMIHAFPLLLQLPEARRATLELADFVRRHVPDAR